MFPRRIGIAAALVVFLGAAFSELHAATPEDAPPASREQVRTALAALAPAFTVKTRRTRAGAPGTIENVIARFAPGKFHPVEDGRLPPPRPSLACPVEMAPVADRFCVDRYEGSLFERTIDGSMQAHPHYEIPEAGHVYIARSLPGVIPQAYISGAQAAAACEAAGKRLCQPVEWRAACGGSQGYAFPYGATRKPGACHDRGAAPMLVFHAEEMKRGWFLTELNDPRLNQLDDTVGKTGSFPACVSDYGIYDMVGNLHEWTADPNGTFQGGYWLDIEQHGTGCAYRTIAHGFTYHDYSTGFRCCSDGGPELVGVSSPGSGVRTSTP
ncbi:formylglycine-generating enzyme family protein [Pendulispora rubella]|uniref:Formylglycine-generating enzyme family protein n=1 Tax=Pendulispora rubella TaxID=2741070 RepID=A0ABZ2LCR5_9BACT